MSASHPILQGPYYRDLLEQPRVLRGLREALVRRGGAAAWAGLGRRVGSGGRVVLTGMGSSLYALQPLHLRWIEAGVTSFHVEAAELLHSQSVLLRTATLLVVASQSGASAEIARLLERRPVGVQLLGVTNVPGSPLAREADEVLWMEAGEEATVSCKTYVATLAALVWLAEKLDVGHGQGDPEGALRELAEAADGVETYLEDLSRRVEEVRTWVGGATQVFVVGRGPSLAAAWTGSLINKEAAGVPVEGMSSAAFRHGPFEMAGAETRLLVLEGAGGTTGELNRRLAMDYRRAGGVAELVGSGSGVGAFRLPARPAAWLPVMEILPLQVLSLALAARAGREAGKFVRGSKVTTVE